MQVGLTELPDPSRRGAAAPGLPGTGKHQERSGRPPLPPAASRRPGAGETASGPQDALAAGQEILRGGRHRPVAAGSPRHRHPLAAQNGDQRRDPQRGDHARGAGVCRPLRHPHHRDLLRPQGRRRRGSGPADPDPGHGLQGPVNPWAAVPAMLTAEPGVLHDATSEVTPIVYGMWMRMLRSLSQMTHSTNCITEKRRRRSPVGARPSASRGGPVRHEGSSHPRPGAPTGER